MEWSISQNVKIGLKAKMKHEEFDNENHNLVRFILKTVTEYTYTLDTSDGTNMSFGTKKYT